MLVPPAATDGCAGVAQIYGEAPAAMAGRPWVFNAGQAIVLKLGNQVVRWFARDVAGNVAVLDQTINVAPCNAGLVTTELGADPTMPRSLS